MSAAVREAASAVAAVAELIRLTTVDLFRRPRTKRLFTFELETIIVKLTKKTTRKKIGLYESGVIVDTFLGNPSCWLHKLLKFSLVILSSCAQSFEIAVCKGKNNESPTSLC